MLRLSPLPSPSSFSSLFISLHLSLSLPLSPSFSLFLPPPDPKICTTPATASAAFPSRSTPSQPRPWPKTRQAAPRDQRMPRYCEKPTRRLTFVRTRYVYYIFQSIFSLGSYVQCKSFAKLTFYSSSQGRSGAPVLCPQAVRCGFLRWRRVRALGLRVRGGGWG